ncbi:MAG TPA: DNA alkylation repair protein [Candidatus Limnocylindrales bacterium]|nr:DNA alkylation repair protein [Candidatus Limnocylindrales bacterium]
MELATALARLEAAGTEQARKTYRRHGAREPLFGVSFAVLDALAREAKRDQALADGLWATGNFDGRLLACKVADPGVRTEAALDAWIADIEQYSLVDVFVAGIAAKVPGVRERADRWAASPRDWTAQAGWDLYGRLALDDVVLEDAYFEGLLERIEAQIATAGNRTRHAMAMNVIAIGSRNERLRVAAEAAAGRIGRVVVDHGDTGCRTPAAVPYLAKVWERRAAKAARANA